MHNDEDLYAGTGDCETVSAPCLLLHLAVRPFPRRQSFDPKAHENHENQMNQMKQTEDRQMITEVKGENVSPLRCTHVEPGERA